MTGIAQVIPTALYQCKWEIVVLIIHLLITIRKLLFHATSHLLSGFEASMNILHAWTCKNSSTHSSNNLYIRASYVASFPDSQTIICTASDRKQGGTWEQGYLMCISSSLSCLVFVMQMSTFISALLTG